MAAEMSQRRTAPFTRRSAATIQPGRMIPRRHGEDVSAHSKNVDKLYESVKWRLSPSNVSALGK
jgi:hypothetical protein